MENRKARHGIPMDAESLKQWQDAFLIIAECIKALYNEKQGGGK
jgi:hypothetical protein